MAAKDRTDFYLAALNSHDGSSAFRFLVSPIRIVCANTQVRRDRGRPRPASPSATPAARGPPSPKPATPSSSAGVTSKRSKPRPPRSTRPRWTPNRCARFANTLLEVDSAGTAATARHRRERASGIVKLWTSSPTIASIAGTRWAAYNAVTEYLDHVVPVRGARTASDANTARALRTITTAAGSGSLKAQAFRLLQTL